MKIKNKNKYLGTNFDDILKAEGRLEKIELAVNIALEYCKDRNLESQQILLLVFKTIAQAEVIMSDFCKGNTK